MRALLKKGEFQASLVDLNEVASDAIRLVTNGKYQSSSHRCRVSNPFRETGFNFTRWC